MNVATTLSAFVPSSVRQVLEQLMVAVEAFWQDNRLPTKHAVGVTQRVLRLQDRIEVLLARFRAGKVKWHGRVAPLAASMATADIVAALPLNPAEAAAAADASALGAEAAGRMRRQVFGLPAYYGWLGEALPGVALMCGSELELAFKSDEIRALMLATPEVARRAGPVFRMLGLDDALLLVPEGYTGPAAPRNRRFYRPPSPITRQMSDDKPPMIVPPEYDEARDGRKPHPLREPDWNFPAFVNYRSYLYYFMGRKPPLLRPG